MAVNLAVNPAPSDTTTRSREETTQAEGLSKHTDERCVAIREALDQVALGLKTLDEVTNITPVEDQSPMELVTLLMPGEPEPLA